MDIRLLTVAAVTGLMGSLHCIGMCGPLAIAVGAGSPRATSFRLPLFVLGKGLTYALIGAITGLVGQAFGGWSAGRPGFAIVALITGAFMVFIGARYFLSRVVKLKGIGMAVSTLLSRALRLPGRIGPLVAGGLAGLLPCGLVYAMAAQAAASGSAIAGAAVMMAFGAGTSPALIGAGWIGGRVGARSRVWGERLAAATVIVMGLVTTWRGVVFLIGGSAGEGGCCHVGGG